MYAAEFRFAAPVKAGGWGVGLTVVLGGAVGLPDVELRNGATESVRVAFLEKMVKVGMTRGLSVVLVVGVGGSSVGVDGGAVGVDGGTIGVGVGTVGAEMDTVVVVLSFVGAEMGNVTVTPALSQELWVRSTIS